MHLVHCLAKKWIRSVLHVVDIKVIIVSNSFRQITRVVVLTLLLAILLMLYTLLYWSNPSFLLFPGKGAEYCDQPVSVCVSVCLWPYLWNRWNHFTKFGLQIPCGRGSILHRLHCATLCTSDFMDDVTFGHSGLYACTHSASSRSIAHITALRDRDGVWWVYECLLIFDIWALWHSALSIRAPECQKLKMMG